MTVKGGTSPACSACKYQRRRCSSECVLAPYFPANQTKAFQNAHRLFGVSNIMKILNKLSTDEQKEEAMKSIKYEADMRERYPVYGCAGIICQLRQQLRQAIEELHCVYAQLEVYREQFNYRNFDSSPQLQLGIGGAPMANIGAPQFQSAVGDEVLFSFMSDEYYDDQLNGVDVAGEGHNQQLDDKVPLVGLERYYNSLMMRNNNNNNNSTIAGIFEEFGEMPTAADDRQSYIETKEAACESSSESSFRDFQHSIDQVSKIELRNAAAYFSLTNIK